MEVMDAGVVQGSLLGTVMNGAALTTGLVGKALKLDGNDQWLDYGNHFDECYHIPDHCSQGITISYWIIMHAYQGMIFTTGNIPKAAGYYIFYGSTGRMSFSAKYESMFDYYKIPDWPLNQWRHVTFTWTFQEGIIIYINGCNADPGNSLGYAYSTERSKPITERHNMKIGHADARGYASMTLDEFFIWHQKLSSEDIWQLYTQGGTV